MSKELEKEYLEDLDHYDEGMGIHSTSYEKCKERLIRLAKIDNAKPSEASEKLDDISYLVLDEIDDLINKKLWKSYFTTIKQALLKAQEQEKVIIELCEYCGMDNLYPYDNLEEIEITFKDTFDNYQLQRITSLGRLNKLEKENAELKRVLSVIKEKSDLSALEMANNVDEFNEMTFHKKPYTEEEFDLLKRWQSE